MTGDKLLYLERLDEHSRRKQGLLSTPQEASLLELSEARPEDWRRVATALSPFMKAKRVIRLQDILRRRRSRLHLVLENIADPHNSASVLRAAEACGLQHIHVIESVSQFQLPAATARAASKGVVGGDGDGLDASRWISLHKYTSTRECAERLDALGLQVFASDCPTDDGEGMPANEGKSWNTSKRHEATAVPIDALDFSASAAGTALVFGNERRGVSRSMLERSCRSFYLPMSGLTQSFNISVAVAMSLYSAIASGAFPEGDLRSEQQEELLGRWLLRDIKAARSVLADVGIEFADF